MISLVNGRARSSQHSENLENPRPQISPRWRRLRRALRWSIASAIDLLRPLELVQRVAPNRPPLSRAEWDRAHHHRDGLPPL
jgi:hypothetical protein